MKTNTLNKMTIDEFRKKYYYAEELKEIAKTIGVKNVSKYRKDELETLIEEFITLGTLPKDKKSSFRNIPKDSDSPLREDRIIERYTNDKATKKFLLIQSKKKNPEFQKKSGSSYWLNRWREEQIKAWNVITYGDLVNHYIFLNSSESPNRRIPSTKMNNFIKDFLENENGSNRSKALMEWKKLKALPIEKNYAAWKEYKLVTTSKKNT